MMDRIVRNLTLFSLNHPRWVILLTVLVTLAFASQFHKVAIDTDPKHMLPVESKVRQFNDQMEKEFVLHPDVIALGIINENGIFNRITFTQIGDLTRKIQEMSGVISRDVVSLATLDNITAQGGELIVHPALDPIPKTESDFKAIQRDLLGNLLFVNRIVSPDGTATAIYVPIEPTANGKAIADSIRKLLPQNTSASGGDRYFLAGDPVARDTFGAEMFRQMGIFSPIAGLVMCIALWFMFRSAPLIIANMAVAMVSIIWSMGLFIGLGYPIHIMSSMSPVFLMAIATDSVHIFNEFAFRYGEVRDKRRAILETMAAVGHPVFYSDLTTALGFAALATATIVPVKVFGLLVGFGTLVILLMSYTLVPAIMALLDERKISRAAHSTKQEGSLEPSYLARLGEFCVRHAGRIAIAGLALLVISGVGLSLIQVNNNMVHWFKSGSDIRVADRELNTRLGGTSTGYLVIEASSENAIKDPAMLGAIEGLQRTLEKDPLVGKTFSVVDIVKRINRVLHGDDPVFDRIPDSATEIGQYLFLFGMSAKPSDLDNIVDYPFQKANLMLQLKSWDAGVMRSVIDRTKNYLSAHPLPGGATVSPAGIATFNLVWSDEVLWGMIESFMAGLALVLIILVLQTRSIPWGILTFLPLLFTIAVIYGFVGFLAKDFDMPVAVLSTLSLGLAVDFAIHFVARFRQRLRERPGVREALVWTVARPGKGILLNALLFALGFAVMMGASLTPYITVGILMAVIMLLSAVMSIVYLPVLIKFFQRILIKGEKS